MLIHLFQTLFVAIKTILMAILNIVLYYLLYHMFIRLLGLHFVISFFCARYCVQKIFQYVIRFQHLKRIKNKKPDEKLSFNELSWQTPTSLAQRTNNETNQFENDWNYLLDNDRNNLFPSIVNISFQSRFLFILTITIIEYQIHGLNKNIILSFIHTISILILLIFVSSIRYQTLYEREQKTNFDLMIKNRDDFERYIIYSNNNDNIPVASICLQILQRENNPMFIVQLYQINSKYNDYFFDLGNYITKSLIERIKVYGNGNRKSIEFLWSIPSCKANWLFPIKANGFKLKYSYKDFSFMPFVHSYIEQYEYVYQFNEFSSQIVDETNREQ